MIQRIQSIWLLLAAVAAFLTIRFPFYIGAFDPVSGTSNIIILILTSALGGAIIVSIFLFRHRSIQVRLVIVCFLVECLIVFLYFKEIGHQMDGNFALGSILHPVIIITLILAMRGIYKDSKIIRESNRLR